MLEEVDSRVFPIKSSSDDDNELKHGFGAFVSLPLTQGAAAVNKKENTRLIRLLLGIYSMWIVLIFCNFELLYFLIYSNSQ